MQSVTTIQLGENPAGHFATVQNQPLLLAAPGVDQHAILVSPAFYEAAVRALERQADIDSSAVGDDAAGRPQARRSAAANSEFGVLDGLVNLGYRDWEDDRLETQGVARDSRSTPLDGVVNLGYRDWQDDRVETQGVALDSRSRPVDGVVDLGYRDWQDDRAEARAANDLP